MGTLFYSYGVLLKPLSEALNVERFPISLALSLQMLVSAAISPWVGKWITQFPIRRIMWAGTAALSLGFIGMGLAQNLVHLYLSFGLVLGCAMALIGPLPNSTLLANWFIRRRGTALGFSQLGISLSGAVIAPLTSWLVQTEGWRTAVILLGIAPAVILAPLIWKFAVNRPEDKGLMPDGDAPASEANQAVEAASDWTFARVLRDRRIWLLVATVGPSFASIGAVLLTLHSHVTDLGLSALEASSLVALTTLTAAVAKPLFGILADLLNKRLMMALSLFCQAIGLVMIVNLEHYAGLVGVGLFFGLGYGAVMPMWSVLTGTLFGREAFARVMGLMTPLTTMFSLIGLPFASLVFDLTGSYLPAFKTLIAGLAISLVAISLLPLPDQQRPSTSQ